MLDRRTYPRDRVLYGGSVTSKGRTETIACVVRNISRSGANLELPSLTVMSDDIRITIPRLDKSLVAKIVWWRADRAGIAFQSQDDISRNLDLDERLRVSEGKARALKQRVAELLRRD